MGDIIVYSRINRCILTCTLGAFIFGSLGPVHASPYKKEIGINLIDINFALRIEKLVEKAKKYFSEKKSVKLNEIMWDIKREVEGYTGQKIDLDNCLDRVEKEAKNRG